MNIKASCVYTREKLLDMNFYLAKSKVFMWIMLGVATSLISFSFVLGLILKTLTSPIIFCFVAVLAFDLIYVYCYFILPYSAVKKSPSLNIRISYDFSDDGFAIYAENINGNESATLKYSVLKKTVLYKDSLFLFISRHQAYVIDVATLEGGTAEELIAHLSSKGVPSKK